MGFRRCLTACFLTLLLLLPEPGSGRQSGASIDGVKLRRGANADLVLDFRVEQALDERILDTLDSGLPVRFTYWVRVERPRDLLRDEVLVDLRLVRVLEKDNLKDRYRVTPEGLGGGKDLSGLQEAVETMSRVQGLSLLPLDAIESRQPLRLRVKAQLQKFQLPFGLHYLFAFVSYWDVETEWYTLELPRSIDALP